MKSIPLIFIQMLRSAGIGIVGTLVNLIVFWLAITEVEMHYLIGATIAHLANMAICFTGDRYWTYKSYKRVIVDQFLKYIVVYGATLFLKVYSLYVLVAYLSVEALFGQIISIAIGGAAGFLLYKFWVFR